jgi:twinkle protein
MSFVKYNQPCLECGGSDPVAINEDGSAWCFSCRYRYPNYKEAFSQQGEVVDFKEHKNNKKNTSGGDFLPLTDRSISLETAKKYGVKAFINTTGDVVRHSYPYYIANEIAGYKIRELNKAFSWRGTSKGSGLFGEQLFADGGKYITVTEGECDAMSAFELMGSKWPVVSVKNGAAGAVKDFKDSIEFLEKFDNIVINFDNDKPGRDAARAVAKLLTPGKAKIATLPSDFKDANDMLRQAQHKAYQNAWWSAKVYTPAGVLNLSEKLDDLINREIKECVPYPWAGLNKKLYGMRQGELVTVTGGTGLGKSSITRELEHWLITNTKDNVGIIALEEDWIRTADGILSIEANARLYIDEEREAFGDAEYAALSTKFIGDTYANRVWIHAHFGATDFDEILNKLKYLIIGQGCRWVVVDHLHMLAYSAGLKDNNEVSTIDYIMKSLRTLVEETGAGLILVSHLRRVDGNRGHENGIEVSLSHLRGSQAIAQISDCVIALERNQQADDDEEANTTHMRVLKSRYTGDVGMASHLLYNKKTGRLKEIDIDDVDDELEPLI